MITLRSDYVAKRNVLADAATPAIPCVLGFKNDQL
jgi:hypothetical protein